MYVVIPVDLSAAFAKKEISPPAKRISEIICFSVPGGASFKMRVGKSSDYMTIDSRFSMEPRGDDEANSGLYITNPVAQAGVTLEIVVVYGKTSDGVSAVV